MVVTRHTLKERFWSKVDRTGECWEWTGSIHKSEYGQIYAEGRPRGAHRVAYELAHGPIPDGMFVCHRCDNRRCVRPDHLFLGTNGDNMRDMTAKGRNAKTYDPAATLRGVAASNAKLTDEAVRDIRRRAASGVCSIRGLAREYGVSKRLVQLVVRRRAWKHVE